VKASQLRDSFDVLDGGAGAGSVGPVGGKHFPRRVRELAANRIPTFYRHARKRAIGLK
jgi:hypothetical protein